MKKLSKALAKFRKNKTMTEAAKQIGISKSYYSIMESGKRVPQNIEMIKKLEKKLQVKLM